MYIKISIAILLVFLVSGCSTKNLYVDSSIKYSDDLDMEYIKEKYDLVEKDCSNTKFRTFIWYIPISGVRYEYTDGYLVDELLDACEGDIATDVKIEGKYAIFFYLNIYAVTAEADIWRKK